MVCGSNSNDCRTGKGSYPKNILSHTFQKKNKEKNRECCMTYNELINYYWHVLIYK
jgi:hypothetical protein